MDLPIRFFRLILLSTLLTSLATTRLLGQKTWIAPADYSFSDSVTIYIDLKACNKEILQNQEKIYLWTMLPNKPVIGNGEWPQSNEDMLMTHEDDDVWSYQMVPTEFYGVDSSAFTQSGWWVFVKVKSPVMTFENNMLKSEDFGLIPEQAEMMMPIDSLHTSKLTIIRHHQLVMTNIRNEPYFQPLHFIGRTVVWRQQHRQYR